MYFRSCHKSDINRRNQHGKGYVNEKNTSDSDNRSGVP